MFCRVPFVEEPIMVERVQTLQTAAGVNIVHVNVIFIYCWCIRNLFSKSINLQYVRNTSYLVVNTRYLKPNNTLTTSHMEYKSLDFILPLSI